MKPRNGIRRFAVGFTIACAGLGAVALPLSAATAGPLRIIYTSPWAGARYVRPSEGIIIRLDRALDRAAPELPVQVTVSGSRSGAHPGALRLADDGRTLLFRPAAPFAWGESVEASLEASVPLEPGVLGARGALSFTIAAGPTPAPVLERFTNSDPMDRLRDGRSLEPAPLAVADTLPAGYPQITFDLYGTPAPGRLMMSSFGSSATPFLIIADNTGEPVFSRAMPKFCTDFKVQPNGRLTYYDTSTNKFYAMDSSYAVVDSFQCGNDFYTDLHELRLLPNGHALLMGIDLEIVDMSAVVPGGNPAAAVQGLVVQELDESKNVVFQWRSWDHFQITDATHEDLTAASIDYVHGNAIELDNDGNLMISSRHMDEITKIDRNTGDVLWRWGGKNNQFTLIGDTVWFSHQHAIRRIANGNVTLFDNGNFRDPPYSRAVEYALDEVNHTAQLVWEYRNTPDTYGNAMGYMQRLDNGSTLISWGFGKPDMIEVAPDGTKVMDLSLPSGVASYRMFRQEWGQEVAAAGAPPSPAISLSASWPNPFRSETEMFVSVPSASAPSFQVLDVQGREVPHAARVSGEGPGRYRVRIRLEGAAAGVYFFRVSSTNGAETRRVVHLN